MKECIIKVNAVDRNLESYILLVSKTVLTCGKVNDQQEIKSRFLSVDELQMGL